MKRRIKGSPEMGERIGTLMAEEGNLSNTEVAEMVGVNRSLVGYWRKGGGIEREHLEKLAAALNTSPAWLRTGRRVREDEDDASLEEQNRRQFHEAEDRPDEVDRRLHPGPRRSRRQGR